MLDGFSVIAIYVKNGCLHCCSYGCCIITATSIIKIGCKSYLVVNHKMNGTPCIITFEFRHLQYFVHYTLPCYGCIAMY